jgi:hypothetical protein
MSNEFPTGKEFWDQAERDYNEDMAESEYDLKERDEVPMEMKFDYGIDQLKREIRLECGEFTFNTPPIDGPPMPDTVYPAGSSLTWLEYTQLQPPLGMEIPPEAMEREYE